MIIQNEVTVRISPSNVKYWRERGYQVNSTGGRAGKNNGQELTVKVSELKSGSNVRIDCQCEICDGFYSSKRCNNTSHCGSCLLSKRMTGNKFGTANKGRRNAKLLGDKHPRWNPNKGEFKLYSDEVRRLSERSYKTYRGLINPNEHPRTVCGVEGGYQLDHVVSVKEGFERKIPAHVIAHVNNLQMLPWKKNRDKWF